MPALNSLSSSLKRAFAPETFVESARKATDLLADHLEQAHTRRTQSSYPGHLPEDERAFWENHATRFSGRDDMLKEVIARSNHLHDPRYMGHQVSVVLPETSATGMVTDLLNNGQAIYEMGPSNAALEDILMSEIGQLLGLPNGCGGILCHGGTLGNLVALMAAQRKAALKFDIDSWEHGVRAFPKPMVVLVSEHAHYCIDRAMRTLGWGAQGTILIKTNQRHQMEVDELKAQIEQCTMNGQQVMAVVGSACTTSAGAFDPLEAIANVCHAHGIWFHVDGAHGAAVAFSDSHRHLLNGIQHADSLVMDFHKTCGIPALCTGVFYAKHADSFLPFSQRAEYLWENDKALDWWDTGKRTFECTKRMLSTRLAAIKAEHGWSIWGELVNRLWEVARALADLIHEHPHWELAMPPEANIVCFRPVPRGDMDINTWNDVVKALRKRHLAKGSGYVVQTEFDGRVWLRCTLMNPLTEETDLTQMLDELEGLLPSSVENMAGN